MADMDERFQQILSWQQMDQNKAISQILQEVSPCPGHGAGAQEGRREPRAGRLNSTWMRLKDRERTLARFEVVGKQ